MSFSGREPRDLVEGTEHKVMPVPLDHPVPRESQVQLDPRASLDPLETLASQDTREMLEHQ